VDTTIRSWLVKQEPETYPWSQLVAEKKTIWDGVRNYQARNFIRQMAKGDLVLFYHSGKAKELVGLAKVAKAAYPDPTAAEGDWSAFDIQPIKELAQTVSLKTIKADPELQSMHLVRNSRLSVMPVEAKEFKRLLDLAETSL
jgi:predicted RNA-binding protein with PUA-like domain